MRMDDRLKRDLKAAVASLYKPRKAFVTMPLRIVLCTMIFCAAIAYGQDYNAHQWQVVEITLTSSVSYADPFQDVDVTATFTRPDGKVITRPAFWDGGLTWKVRFAPPQTGLWTMITN